MIQPALLCVPRTRGRSDDDVRAADAALAAVPPDGARPLLQLGDLMDETDALDERLALPAAAARGQGALGHLQRAHSVHFFPPESNYVHPTG